LPTTAMATALQSFCFAARSCRCRPGTHQYASKSIAKRRVFSTTLSQRRSDDKDIDAKLKKAGTSMADLQPPFTSKDAADAVDQELEGLLAEFRSLADDALVAPPRKKRLKQTFMNLGEPEPWEEEHLMTDDHDDMTPLGHGELEKHREMRHYARLAAWEMPLLSSMYRKRS
jgi:small subunit ribosomal protein S35